jgi:hypothetical protein
METSLRFDSRTKHLCLFAKEKFSNDDNYVLTVRVPRAPSGRERPNPNPRAREAATGRGFSIRHLLPGAKEAVQSRSSRLFFSDARRTRKTRHRLATDAFRSVDLYAFTSPLVLSRSCRRTLFLSFTNAKKVSGSLDTKDGRVESRAYVRKKFFPDAFLSRVDMGLSYATTADDVTYGINGKKSFELTDDGLTTLDVKGGVSMGSRSRGADVDARVELTQKIFNFQEDQDLKLRVGVDLSSRKVYGQIRENNWTFNTDFKEKWDVRYDL